MLAGNAIARDARGTTLNVSIAVGQDRLIPGWPAGDVIGRTFGFLVQGAGDLAGQGASARGSHRRGAAAGVLLRLLALPGRLLRVDVVAEDVWDGVPPAVISALQSQVSTPACDRAGSADLSDGGYQLETGPVELDPLTFKNDLAFEYAAMSADDFESAAGAPDRGVVR